MGVADHGDGVEVLRVVHQHGVHRQHRVHLRTRNAHVAHTRQQAVRPDGGRVVSLCVVVWRTMR